MSYPEISKRCLECGASVRADARFCPQCGKLMKKDSSPPLPPDNGAAQNASSTARDVSVATPTVAVASEAGSAMTAATTTAATTGAQPSATDARRENSESRRRPAEMVKDNLRPRVEKLRDASMTVFEEASDDTGLRFVLIAFALFLLFLLFLFLNNIIR